jgi:DNA-binding protein HU-beta
MPKTDFIKAVAERANQSQKETKEIIDAAIEVITEALQRRERVVLTGFGTFEVRQRQARKGVHPQTRSKILIPATRVPGFSASSTLKNAVKDS